MAARAPYRLDASVPVAVVGAGTMGAGIAQLAAQAGHPVRLFDAQMGAPAAARERIASDLASSVKRGRLPPARREEILAQVGAVERFESLSDCGLIIEAIVERLEPKQDLFRELENVLASDAVLATNTSSISISALASTLRHRGRLIGWHFFNPAPRMKLVEVIAGLDTDPALIGAMQALSVRWGKTAVQAPNTPGFLVNRVARPYYAEALRLLAERSAPVPVIDKLLREAAGFPMGPFELMDLIGLDVNLSVTESVFRSTAFDARYAPHWLQQELVRGGRLGRKTGQGFYGYGAERPAGESPTAQSPTVAGGSMPQAVRLATDMGLLSALRDRLVSGGVPVATDPALPRETLALDDTLVMITDGRTATQRAAAVNAAVLLLDLALDYSSTKTLGATASQGAEGHLGVLSAVLHRAGIELLALADVAGLVVMRTVCCLANEAADLLSWTATTIADIDAAMRLAMSYPQGPLAWADALGPSRVVSVLQFLQEHYGDMRYRRAPQLLRVNFAGSLFHG